MAFRIVHRNSQGCWLNEEDTDKHSQPYAEEGDTNDMLISYVRNSDVYAGDTIVIVEC